MVHVLDNQRKHFTAIAVDGLLLCFGVLSGQALYQFCFGHALFFSIYIYAEKRGNIAVMKKKIIHYLFRNLNRLQRYTFLYADETNYKKI